MISRGTCFAPRTCSTDAVEDRRGWEERQPDDPVARPEVVPPADAPIDRIAELKSIIHEMRAFVAGENRHVNVNGCLTVHCQNEEIEDAVYALGIVFDLEYLFPRGDLCVKFALRLDTPTIIDDDKLRGIICGDLLNTPTRAMAKKLWL
ncbi:uncharacterized protein ARMOST_11825 [Armillaria ostoyae]|uniref:Uncharacterized protein n=1 Tax=Armillaria ostoyae TaxID=47428 RepID=A0A284RI74_ARMOS|nr:uncharacterized protein ARMOST_11825 [Armillaria ostoyae]